MADITKLRPKTQELCKKFVEECKKEGIIVVITQTLRSIEVQNAYYAQGRNDLATVNKLRKIAGLTPITLKENTKVTNAKGGTSPHNYGLSFDFVPIVNGKADWNNIALFKKCGAIGIKLGLEWGGNFKSIVDLPHFQYPNWKNYI